MLREGGGGGRNRRLDRRGERGYLVDDARNKSLIAVSSVGKSLFVDFALSQKEPTLLKCRADYFYTHISTLHGSCSLAFAEGLILRELRYSSLRIRFHVKFQKVRD